MFFKFINLLTEFKELFNLNLGTMNSSESEDNEELNCGVCFEEDPVILLIFKLYFVIIFFFPINY